jgi:hypothetical protein
MLALGEDPEEFERLHQDLLSAYEPADPLSAKQVEDLAKLYWRRAREGLVRHELELLQREQQRRRTELERAAFAPSEGRLIEVDLPRPQDAAARLRQALSYLEVRERVAQRDITLRLAWVFQHSCGDDTGWRTNLITSLLKRFARDNRYAVPPKEDDYPKLVELLAAEIGSVREALEVAQRESLEMSTAERAARLAPTGREWALMVCQENALDLAIDRKVRILMDLLRVRASKGIGDHGPGNGSVPGDGPGQAEVREAATPP